MLLLELYQFFGCAQARSAAKHAVRMQRGTREATGRASRTRRSGSRRTTTRACLDIEKHCRCKARVRGEAAIRRDSKSGWEQAPARPRSEAIRHFDAFSYSTE